MKQKLLILGGSTAVGKSDFALKLSKYLNMEIISADSVQVYRDLNVGTSKPSKEEEQECKHHLINMRNFDERFNAFDFVTMATKSIEDINKLNKLPVIVGGTGLYIESLLFSYSFSNKKENKTSKYDFKLYVLNEDREKLYEKINKRVDKMIEKGLIEEVKDLRDRGIKRDFQSMQAIGYKEIFSYLENEIDLETAIEKMKQATRNYAKRQITWFKHMKDAVWIDVNSDLKKITQEIVNEFKEYQK